MSHFMKICKECGTVVEQCRCMDCNKEKIYVTCPTCTGKVFIVDMLEHGNCGVYGTEVLAEVSSLYIALMARPQDYDVSSKEWGFWPVISATKDGKDPLYTWDEADSRWEVVGVKSKPISLSLKQQFHKETKDRYVDNTRDDDGPKLFKAEAYIEWLENRILSSKQEGT